MFYVALCLVVSPSTGLYPPNCYEIFKFGIKENGIYTIQPDPQKPALEVHHTQLHAYVTETKSK